MKIRVSFEMDYEPSTIAEDIHDNLTDKWLSDWDFLWMVEEGHMTNAKVEVLEHA